MQIIQAEDKSVIISVVKGENNVEAILKPNQVPYTITKLRQYFERLFQNMNGGNMNHWIMIAFDSNRESLQ